MTYDGSFANGLNYSVSPPQLRQTWQSITRVDHNFSESDRVFVRFGRYNPNADAQNRIPNRANNDTSGGFRDTQVALSETHVFSTRIVNDFRARFAVTSDGQRFLIPSTAGQGGPAVAKVIVNWMPAR